MQLRLKDGTLIEVKRVEESIRIRRKEQLLLITIEGNYSTKDIINIFTINNIREITLIDADDNQKIFNQYRNIESLLITYDKDDFNYNRIDLTLTDLEDIS